MTLARYWWVMAARKASPFLGLLSARAMSYE